jgi:glucose-6-phosphate isomerase
LPSFPLTDNIDLLRALHMSNGLSQRYPSFKQLVNHQQTLANKTLLSLFAQDPHRTSKFTHSACGLGLDFSKNFIVDETLTIFNELLKESGFAQARAAMFAGEIINQTERRRVLHTALRSPYRQSDQEKAVHEALEKTASFVDSVHSGKWRGFTHTRITDVVNIGIGGSDLGPRMVCQSLAPFQVANLRCHFVANIDGADLHLRLQGLNPETTLFIIASKSFSTLETLENGKTARTWLMQAGCASQDVGKHFVAITTNLQQAVAFGIEGRNCFPIWDWVGGRYSLWSAIGLPIALSIGMDNFRALLAGAHAMDKHFCEAPVKNNLPIMQALLVFWYAQCWQVRSQVILPYNHHLGFFPAYLQQLEMESLGKCCDRDGNSIDYQTGLVVWGTEGTNGQHSFHQLLHQGTQLIPADFIVSKKALHPYLQHQQHLIANCLAQSQALMCGKPLAQAKQELLNAGSSQQDADKLAPHKVIPGNRPSTTILLEELNPHTLGALIALYEHKVFTLSVLYNINAFDQWGVELGKQLSGPIYAALLDKTTAAFDPSTLQLIKQLNR